MGWAAHKLQRWPGVRYRIGTTTNNTEETGEVLKGTDNRMPNVLGIARTDH